MDLLLNNDLDLVIQRALQLAKVTEPLPEYLTPVDIAKILKVSPISVRRWIKKGLLKHSKIDGGSVRVKRSDFNEFLKDIEQ